MAAREIDLDKVVDYRSEYTAVVQKYKLTGDKLTGLCPFHEDRNNSLSVDLKTGKWHCFAEDRGGNFVSFWAELHGVDTKEAYKQILEKYGVAAETPKPAKKEKATVLEDFSLAEYAFRKFMPSLHLLIGEAGDHKPRSLCVELVVVPAASHTSGPNDDLVLLGSL